MLAGPLETIQPMVTSGHLIPTGLDWFQKLSVLLPLSADRQPEDAPNYQQPDRDIQAEMGHHGIPRGGSRHPASKAGSQRQRVPDASLRAEAPHEEKGDRAYQNTNQDVRHEGHR